MTVEEHLQKLHNEIENYVPETKWEEANGRTLKMLIARRNNLEKVVERKKKMNNTVDVLNGQLLINGTEIPLEVYNEIVTEEIDKEIINSLKSFDIEVDIRYLTSEEGGRKTPVCNGYRGQFFYDGQDWDGFQYFPDLPYDAMVELGTTVRALVRFQLDRWENIHSKKITVGMPFQIREGNKTVGCGTVTKV